MRARVLVVDDDPALAEMLGIVLRSEGFSPAFVADGERALAAFRDVRPDIVLLDLMLPGMSGIDVCRAIRAESGVPIVMLTAKTDTVDVVLGLESGADDYVMKPFKPKELVARMRARLRRGEDVAPEVLTIGPGGNQVTIDVPAHLVTREREEIKLTPLEFDLLVALARKPRQVFTREVLLEQVWGYRHAADTRLVNVHVQRLRAKIEADPGASGDHLDRSRRGLQGRNQLKSAHPMPINALATDQEPDRFEALRRWRTSVRRSARPRWPRSDTGGAGVGRCSCGWSRTP